VVPLAEWLLAAARTLPLASIAAAVVACASASSGGARTSGAAARTTATPPALDAITEADLRRDIFTLAGDEMRGREAGTLDELRASMWLADRAREAGLEPAGDDGTFFQFWPMRRTRLSDASTITIAGRRLTLWRDVVVTTPITATVDLPLAFVSGSTAADGGSELQGKAAVAVLEPPANPPRPTVSLYPYRYALTAIRQQSARLVQRGASAVILVADSVADDPMAFGFGGVAMARGRYGLDTSRTPVVPLPNAPGVPVLWVRRAMLDTLRALATSNARLSASLVVESFSYPSVNVVGRIRGTDPARRDEYVLFSGHQDHDGVRYPIAGDSIWNGADDNASVSVALLAIARAFKRQPSARSALFVWHGAEERGLLGSNWYALHPTVPKSSIVAVLNGDMIGRNNPDSAALLGVQPPHLNSRALVDAALRANDAVTHFKLDTLWDRPTHNEGWYFRSDHLPYARAGIPAIFFSTLLHPDYHTPRDEPSRIDIAKLARMARWMYATGWAIGEAPARPDLVPGFKLER
jgi:peptidase M28-like protein